MKTLLFLIAITISLVASGQDLLWKNNFTGTGNNIAGKSAIDPKDNIYIIGVFNSSIDLPSNLTSKGANDIFLTKYSKNGSILWTRQIGGTLDDTPQGIAISPDGEYIYITGIFQQTAYAENLSITSTGSYDGFLAKYRQNGDLLWIKNIASGNMVQRPAEIKIDKNNHLTIGGLFESELKLGTSVKDTTFNTTKAVGLFFSQHDTTGTLIKAKKFEATFTAARVYTFDTDASGYYLTGHFKGDLITDLGTYTSNNESLDMYVYKLDFNLESKWIMKAAGTANDQLYSCSVDNKGYFYVGGHFASNILVVDSLPNGILSKKTGINKTTNGKYDIFFAKYKHDGTLQWFNTAGSTENDYLYRANFQNGYFIAAGQYGGTLTFRNKTITPFNTADAFAIIHTSSNNLVGLVSIGGTGNDTGETALIDENNDAIVIGDYVSSKIFFTPTDSLVNSNSGTRDMFIAKYHLNLLNIPQTVEVQNPYRFKSTVEVDSLLTADSIVTPQLRTSLIKFNDGTSMSTASTGSTITASDGVYMDGTTVKLGGASNDAIIISSPDISLIGSSGSNFFGIGATFNSTILNINNGSSGSSIQTLIDDGKPSVNLSVSTPTKNVNLLVDTTGIFYTYPPDTTLTTPLHLMTEAQVKREINAMQPTNNILAWDAANKWYAPYSSKQASMSFYTGTTNPTLTARLNLDGKLYSSGFSVTTGSTNTVGFQCATNTGSAYGVYVNNNVGDGIYVLNSSSSSGIKIDNGSTVGLLVNNNSNGEGIKIQYSGSNRVSNFLNLTKSQSGTQDADGHFIKITDNSTTSGTITGKVLSAIIGTTERISLNPRATSTTTPYIFQTHNKPTANLFEFGIQGRNKVYADTSGHITYKGTYASIFRHKSLGDTTQSIPTGTTPTKVLAFSTNGEQSNCTADKTNDKITITKTGRYMVNLSLSYASGTNAVNWTAYIFNNGVESENIHSTGYTSTANDKRSTSLSGIINVTSVPCDIDYRVSHSAGASVDLIMTYVNLNVNYIGD